MVITDVEVLKELESADLTDDKTFRRLLNDGMELADIEDADLAESVGASTPTVRRWRSGAAVPHPLLRPAIFNIIRKKLENV